MTEITEQQEQVVMTPKGKTANSTTLLIERRAVKTTSDKMHVAGGEHTGIVINKEVTAENDTEPAHLCLEFRVFLISSQTGKHTQESRTLRFWFRPQSLSNGHSFPATNGFNGHAEPEDASVAQDFFKELVCPQEFPRDYVGFIKKIIKQMQLGYKTIKKVEVELKQLEDAAVPNRPLSVDENTIGHVIIITVKKVLELIESAYPNPVTIQDIAKTNSWDEEDVAHHVAELQSRGLVKAMEHGAFTRQQSQDGAPVTVVKQMPTIAGGKQPTIAIITAQYCEKMAVDAMLENKETFVRYTTVGESNVYTLGNIGAHRIVCTKLPSVGHTREAMTAAGNTTTRLLGTFQKVDYVFLVGTGGGVPHYTDYNKHVRLGDVVVSCPVKNKDIYIYCNSATSPSDNPDNPDAATAPPVSTETYTFDTKSYAPAMLYLQDIASRVRDATESSEGPPPWFNYINEALTALGDTPEQSFYAPAADTDKLYMNIGEGEMIEVAHPVETGAVKRFEGCPRLHLAPIASGRQAVRSDQLRQRLAARCGARAFDAEFDPVIESVLGNCKDSFICVRGIADYKDGTRGRDWQPYASLAAAAVMKTIVCGMDAQ